MRESLSTQAFIVLLIIGLLSPVLAFSALLLSSLADSVQEQQEARALEVARRTAADLDRDIAAIQVALEALSTSPMLHEDKLAEFAQQANEVARMIGAGITLNRTDGMALKAAPRLPGSLVPLVLRAPASGRSVQVSDLLPSGPDERRSVVVSLPLSTPAGSRQVLSASLPPERFGALLAEQQVSPAWTLAVVDRGGTVVARNRSSDAYVGKLASADLRANATGQEGVWPGTTLEGTSVLAAYARSSLSGFRVSVGVPRSGVEVPLTRSLLALAAFGSLALGLSVAAGWRLGRIIAQRLRELADAGAALGRGAPVPPVDSRVREIRALVAALTGSADELARRAAQRDAAEGELRASESRFALALAGGRLGSWEVDLRSGRLVGNDCCRAMMGAVPGDVVALLARIHPADRRRSIRTVARAVRAGSHFELEHRLLAADGGIRWLQFRGQTFCEGLGTPVSMSGVALDVSRRKEDEERLGLMVNELNHRVKNSLASVQSIASHSLRNAVSLEAGREALTARLMALAGAHDVLTAQRWQSADLRDVVATAVSAHRPPDAQRVRVQGPPVRLPPPVVLAFSMALHELATNAAKYGALSNEAGQVAIEWTLASTTGGPRLYLYWRETGGPAVTLPKRRGFGSRLIERSLSAQLRGTVQLHFEADGLVCAVDVPLPDAEPSIT